MAPTQSKLTINTKASTMDKPGKSPAFSIDSGIDMHSPTSAGHTMTSPGLASSPTQGHGTGYLTPPESPISTVINGRLMDASQIETMGRELAQARANGEFPGTTTPTYDMQAILDDHARLLRLREARGDAPRSEWNRMRQATELLVQFTREIRQRDGVRGEQTETTNIQARVANMIQGLHGETNLYRLVQHAVHHAIQNQVVQQDLATGGVNLTHILDLIRGVVQENANTGRNGVTEGNMETILEDIFGIIEHSLLDATGPLRMNVNRMDGQIHSMDNITTAQQSLVTAQESHINAIGQHVNAISGQVGAMGGNITSMGNLLNSTNGNITAMTSQLGLLQTIVNMLPQMIARAVQEILPQALQDAIAPALQESVAPALVPIIVARLQERVGTMKGGVSTTTGKDTEFNEKITPPTSPKKSSTKSPKKDGFFKRIFGFGGPKRDHHGEGGASSGGISI